MASSPLAATCYRFGRFTLEPDRRALSADGAPVVLSSRAAIGLQCEAAESIAGGGERR
jgi:DNA-binding winged helix-turn-helix (wHTH) protein